MPNSSPKFTVHDGGTGPRKAPVYYDTGVLNADGKPLVRQGSGGGGDGSSKVTLPDLRWNVALLNGLALVFTAALGSMWLWMVDRIDDKFEASGERIIEISDKVGDLRVDIANQGGDIKTVLEKLEGETSLGSSSKQQAGPAPD